ncbi:Alpha/beta hydrolase fold-3, partial [Syncephalis pseudoplumigaleata]
VVLYLHGGGYFAGSAATHRAVTSRLAQDTGAAVFALNYRLAPEHPFPAALQDALAAYFYLTQAYLTEATEGEQAGSDAGSIFPPRDDVPGIPPERIIVAGDSAGGGLAIALLLALRDLHLPMPAGATTLSPWLDQSGSSTGADTNSASDFLPNPHVIDEVNTPWWQSDADREHFYVRQRALLTCPYVSPLWANDLSGLPPILLVS